MGLHYHDSFEINLYEGLRGKAFLNGFEYHLEDYGCLLLPPGTLHSYLIPSQPGQIVVIQISFRHLKDYLNGEELARAMGIPWSHLPFQTDSSDIKKLCYALMELPGGIENLLCWIIDFLRALKTLVSPGKNVFPADLDWLKRVIAFSESSLGEKITLARAATEAGFSPAYFSRMFRGNTGLTYGNYLQSLRLDKAKELLARNVTVSEAAELCGFRDTAYFIKVFRECLGESPGRYKSSLSEKG